MKWESDQKPVLYKASHLIVKFALHLFFEKIQTRHSHNIPQAGPVIFVVNHPNSIMDALLFGILTERKVNYIAHAGLFNNSFFGYFLRSCGTIPVYRQVDNPEKMGENTLMFAEAVDRLEHGETIGIFPEGVSDMQRKVQRLKTGAARIVFEAEKKHDYGLGVKLIPVGLHFFSRFHFQSRVLANFGRPIDLTRWFDQHKDDSNSAVKNLTTHIQHELEKLTISVENHELEDAINEIEEIYHDELRTAETDTANTIAEKIDFQISKGIADCVQHFSRTDPERFIYLRRMVQSYLRRLKHLRLRDAMLRENISYRQTWVNVFSAYFQASPGLLPAIYGILNNYIPYRITESIARKFVHERTKILTALFFGGGISFFLFHAIQSAVVAYFFGAFAAAVYFLSLPLSGFYALKYITGIRALNKKLSFSFYLLSNKTLLKRMRHRRNLLVAELDKMKEEYLTFIDAERPNRGRTH